MASADNPILNSPYDEPARHYATDAQGNLNYRDIRPGRRIFTPDVPQVPIGQQNQGSMFAFYEHFTFKQPYFDTDFTIYGECFHPSIVNICPSST